MSHKQEVRIGNCLDLLRQMPDESVDVVVTSPPYWALRNYGSDPVVWGGDPNCDHCWEEHTEPARGGVGENANVGANRDGEANNRGHPTVTEYCTKCGAWRGQLGLEPTPFEYIDHLMLIFDEVKRVLKPTGACWVNIGDTYNGSKTGNTDVNKNGKAVTASFKKARMKEIGPKSKCMVPERFAIAMCDHGWILRSEVIWHKPNVMPQSMHDRFTPDFEPFYFFTKEPQYYFNQLTEPIAEVSKVRAQYGFKSQKANGGSGVEVDDMSRFVPEERNMRCVWSIPTSGSKIEHCAMFPKTLVERPVKACCPPSGVVLDPFAGSGTVLEYCFDNDITCIGMEINPDFKEIIEKRMNKKQSTLSAWTNGSDGNEGDNDTR